MVIGMSCSYFAEPADTINLPSLFTNNMVLQQKTEVPIWGKATPTAKVTVQFQGQKKGTVAAEDSSWRVTLDSLAAGGPFEMTIIGKDTIRLQNVFVGEVWLCSGQSNMEMPLAGWGEIRDFEREIAQAQWPQIRLFQVNHAMSLFPQEDVSASPWVECSPQTIPQFSAVGYFFGRALYKDLSVPIGLIHSSWGGTPAEAWTSAGSLTSLADYAPIIESMQTSAASEAQMKVEYDDKLAEWQALVEQKVQSAMADSATWESVALDESAWNEMNLPVLWESAGLADFDGIVWFRKTFTLPSTLPTETWTLRLGPIDDQDITFVNGQQVGSTDGYNIPREYAISGDKLKPGDNVIAIRVLDTGGGGGVWGSKEQLQLINSSGKQIDLAGKWRYRSSISITDIPPRPQSPDSPYRPTVLYNAMSKPLMPFAIRGAIWYQGEANAGRAYQYRELFPTMIQSWRVNWQLGDFPFLFVQLANFQPSLDHPADSEWAELREAQSMTLSLPATGMAVAIDIGDAKDIHPKNKQDVGYRLALNALAKVYQHKVIYSGPIYQSMSFEDNKIRLHFDHVGSGLMALGDKLTGFAVAGEDKVFVWADATIDGNTILVSHPDISRPVAVRYAWADNPICNLYNREGLPALPFRTDDWDGITKGKK